MRGHDILAGRAPSDSTRAHAALNGSNWSCNRCVGRRGCLELAIDRRGSDCNRNFVIAATTAKVDQVGVVRIMKNAQEVSLAQTLTVATKKLAGFAANDTGRSGGIAFRNCTNRAFHKRERFIASETQSG